MTNAQFTQENETRDIREHMAFTQEVHVVMYCLGWCIRLVGCFRRAQRGSSMRTPRR